MVELKKKVKLKRKNGNIKKGFRWWPFLLFFVAVVMGTSCFFFLRKSNDPAIADAVKDSTAISGPLKQKAYNDSTKGKSTDASAANNQPERTTEATERTSIAKSKSVALTTNVPATSGSVKQSSKKVNVISHTTSSSNHASVSSIKTSKATRSVVKNDGTVIERNTPFSVCKFKFNEYEATIVTQVIDQLVEFLKRNPNAKVIVSGYTDQVGSPSYNLQLSKKRANSVKDILAGQGINSTRIECYGKGISTSFSSDEENRRADIVVI